MSEMAENTIVADLAQQAMEPKRLAPGEVLAVVGMNGSTVVVDTDEYALHPRRAQGARTVTDAASFVEYVNRHATPGTEVYAHSNTSSVVGVLDSHAGAYNDPGWQGHRVSLVLEHTKAWLAWAKHDLAVAQANLWFGQEEFAEFIEQRALDVIEPAHADLIDIATTFTATKSADFNSTRRLDNGDVNIAFTETTKAKAGQKGDLTIPQSIRLAIRPYVGGPLYSLRARFRYRLVGGSLMLGYALERPENILESAFDDIVTEIREGKTIAATDGEPQKVVHEGIGTVPLFYGKP